VKHLREKTDSARQENYRSEVAHSGSTRVAFERDSTFNNETPQLQDRPPPLKSRAHHLSQRLIVVEEPRILYLSIPKCGCTFVKNVLWHLQFGRFHPNPIRVHDDDNKFLRASDIYQDTRSILEESVAFTVVRNPVDRFLSLYFDKIIGQGRDRYVPLAQILIERHRLIEKPTRLTDHQFNLDVLSVWLQNNLSEALDLPNEAHWTPQAMRTNVMREFNLKLLTVDNLRTGLLRLLENRVPDIEEIVSGAERNQSKQHYSKKELLTNEVRRRINETYNEDRKLYRRAALAWENLEADASGTSKIPRFRSLFV
jgi:hypothetical protein